MPSIELQSPNLRTGGDDEPETTKMAYFNDDAEEQGFEEQSFSDTDSCYSFGYLSTIWEESSIDLDSTNGDDPADTLYDADSPPSHPQRTRSVSPTARGRSLSDEYDATTNEWMAAVWRPQEYSSRLELVVDERLEDSPTGESLNDYLKTSSSSSSSKGKTSLDMTSHQGVKMSLDTTSHQNVTLISLTTGEKKSLSESDDEFTFVSCSTDDHSILTDIDSSYRSFLSDDDLSLTPSEEEEVMSKWQAEIDQEQNNIGEPSMTLEEIGSLALQTIPEDEDDEYDSSTAGDEDDHLPTNIGFAQSPKSAAKTLKLNTQQQRSEIAVDRIRRKVGFELNRKSVKENFKNGRGGNNVVMKMTAYDPLKRKLNFALNRKNFEVALVSTQNRLPRPEEASLMKLSRSGSNSNLFSKQTDKNDLSPPKREKDSRMKYRLERLGGQRRQLNYQRSKTKLMKKLKLLNTRPRKISQDGPSKEVLERFGGLQRRESFKKSKKLFEESISKISNELLSPPARHRQRSLSPTPPESRRERIKDFMTKMSKSESNLDWMQSDLLEQNQEKEVDAIDTSSQGAMKRRHKLERYSGQRRRNTFERSRKALSKNMTKSKSFEQKGARSKEDVERFGGLHRMESYRKSRELFKDNFSNDYTRLSAKRAINC